jgi:P-type conjugative transfer protein TrbJ
MNMIHRRNFLPCAAAAFAALALPTLSRTARAIPVIDVAGITQIITQWQQIRAQVNATHAQVEALRAAARQLDPRSYQSVQNLLAGNDVNDGALIRDVRTMGYTLDRVNAQFRRYFPDEPAVKSMTPAQFESNARDMNQEIYGAALVSARAQTTLRTVEENNQEARNVLSRSEGNESQVAQLQVALQMLGLIHQNLVGINQLVSSAGRVTSNVAVRGVTARRIERERTERMTHGYSKDEPIPEVDSRLLKSW